MDHKPTEGTFKHFHSHIVYSSIQLESILNHTGTTSVCDIISSDYVQHFTVGI